MSIRSRMSQRLAGYRKAGKSGQGMEQALAQVKGLFTRQGVREYVFEPVRELVLPAEPTTDARVRAVITQVALSNAVLAGMPGKLGVGVFVCWALEAWMAVTIARNVGVRIERPADALKYLATTGGAAAVITSGFGELVSSTASLLSFIPGLSSVAVVPAELLVTNFVGVLFWIGFKEVAEGRNFRIPAETIGGAWREALELARFQGRALRRVASRENVRDTRDRLVAWIKGDVRAQRLAVTDDALVALAAADLAAGETHRLEGPVGAAFLESLRAARPQWAEVEAGELATLFAELPEPEAAELASALRAEVLERLGDDGYLAPYAGEEDGVVIQVSENGELWALKVEDFSAVEGLEEALILHAGAGPVLAAEAAEDLIDADQGVSAVRGVLVPVEVGEANFDEMAERAESTGRSAIAGGLGVASAVSTVMSLWPFAAAYARGAITRDQLGRAFGIVLKSSGTRVAERVAGGAALGPAYLWYALARSVIALTDGALREEEDVAEREGKDGPA
ncbi:MAG: hypothetical protein GF320_04430 [Armatimonadia bacterium]|nr:hypothetical protein [Armatimonadia bacterium]